MLVGFDIDGVLYPWEEAVRLAVEERFGVELGTMDSWDAYKGALGRERWNWLWSHEGTDAVMGRVELVYPGVVDVVTALTRHGEHSVHFVTHRDPRRTGVYTAAFLHLHFGAHPWAGTHVIQSGTPKRTLARWDVFVDDKPETVFDLVHNTGAQVFAPRRPWNVDELEALDGDGWGFTLYDDPVAIVEWIGQHG